MRAGPVGFTGQGALRCRYAVCVWVCTPQPFNSTALLSRLVKQAEALLQGKLTTSNCPPQAPQTATQTESANQANEREGSAPAPAPPAAPNQDPTHVGIGDGGRLAGGGGQQTHAEAGAGGVVFVDVGTTSGAVSTVMSGVTSVVSGVASGISCVGEGHRLISDSALFRWVLHRNTRTHTQRRDLVGNCAAKHAAKGQHACMALHMCGHDTACPLLGPCCHQRYGLCMGHAEGTQSARMHDTACVLLGPCCHQRSVSAPANKCPRIC